MTALKAHEVARFLNRPDLREGVFLVYGQDAGLVRETAQKLLDNFAAGDAVELVTLDGADLDGDPGRLAVEAKTGSLFSARRLLRVRGSAKSLATGLSEFTIDPGGAAIVVEAGNLTPKDPLRAVVEGGRYGRTLPCYPDSDETVLRLISETLSKAGIAADPDVAPALRDLLGNDREITRRELEKLTLYALESKRLTHNDIVVLSADNSTLALDAIADAVGTGRADNMDEALTLALAAATNPQQILAAALFHFAALRRWRSAVGNGRSARDVLDNARPKPHFSRHAALEQQLRLWNDAALATAGSRLALAVADSRRRPLLAEAITRRTLLALCRIAAEA